MASRDDDLTRAQRGATANALREQLEHRINDKCAAIIARAIAEYRGGILTSDNARAYIAAIAEVRGLLIEVTREAREGQEARERLMSPSPDGTATRSR